MPRPQRQVPLLGALGAAAALALPAVPHSGMAQTQPVQWQPLDDTKALKPPKPSFERVKQGQEQKPTPAIWTRQPKSPIPITGSSEAAPSWGKIPNANPSNTEAEAQTPQTWIRPEGQHRFVLNADQPEWKRVGSDIKGTPVPNGLQSKEASAKSTIQWQRIQSLPANQTPIIWTSLPKGLTDENIISSINKSIAIPLPPEPKLQALNRSITFADNGPGPDIAMKVPQGFRWSEQWFLDASVGGANTRPPNSSFWAWNNGDAGAELHVRAFQQQNWSFGVNATFRSVYQGNQFAGGSTAIGDGFATGFRLDHALSRSSGIALGGEQLIQYDSNNDSGRNLYLVGSKGWWLGGHAGQFPLLIGTAGIGTGRLGDNPSLQFGCVAGIDASIDVTKAYPLCWSPIGSAAVVFNSSLSLFTEYNSEDWLAAISLNANDSFPIRLTWGVIFANKGTNYNYVGDDNLRWFFRGSISL